MADSILDLLRPEDVGRALSDPEEVNIKPQTIEPISLTDAQSRGAGVVDLTNRLGNRSVNPRFTSASNAAGTDRPSFGQRVGNSLRDPDVISALAQFGIAFSGGRPNAPGTILGQFALQNQATNVERQISQRIERGETLADIPDEDLRGLSPEGLQRLRGIEQQQVENTFTDTELRQRRRALDLQEEGVDLRRLGLALDQEKFDLTEKEVTRRLDLAEQNAIIDRQLTQATADLRAAQALQLQNEDGEDQSADQVALRRERLLTTLQRSIESDREVLRIAEDDVRTSFNDITGENLRDFRGGREVVKGEFAPESGGFFGFGASASFGGEVSAVDTLTQRQALDQLAKEDPEFKEILDRRDAVRGRVQENEKLMEEAIAEQARDLNVADDESVQVQTQTDDDQAQFTFTQVSDDVLAETPDEDVLIIPANLSEEEAAKLIDQADTGTIISINGNIVRKE